ncbi:bifunctional glutamate N-acetyltransferase/amino-acid acetyltransferase ArgJ [Candidatus Latescibacterota bacterium]
MILNFIKGSITAPLGFRAGAIKCGIKYKNKSDLALIVSDNLATCAGVFTRNRIKAAPVLVSREHVKNGIARAIIVNSGNANACTGEYGLESAIAMAAETARNIKCDASEVLVSSTGVIGRIFPIDKVVKSISKLVSSITYKGSSSAAKAIMTTDTVPKETAVEFEIDGKTIRIGAIAKGAGMICPDMATMLSFITTDAEIEKSALRKSLREAVESSFNSITIDGDMSPNDTVLILANGRAENSIINTRTKAYDLFTEALTAVCLNMAKSIVRDGEGATKFITVKITGAAGKEEARQVGLAIANSPLVKTAFFGEDPNWGRIICAAGYSGVSVDESNITIVLNGSIIFENGRTNSYDENELRKGMSQKDVELEVDLGMGKAEITIYTTDMSYDYIKINAEYTT